LPKKEKKRWFGNGKSLDPRHRSKGRIKGNKNLKLGSLTGKLTIDRKGNKKRGSAPMIKKIGDEDWGGHRTPRVVGGP